MMFHDMTIRNKLTVLLMSTAVIAVMLACFVFYVMTMKQFRLSYEEDLSGLADILGKNCEASVAFRIPEEAERVLASLSVRPSVVYATVRDQGGHVLASYRSRDRSAAGDTIAPPTVSSSSLLGGNLTISRDIVMGGSVIGTLSLYDDMRGISKARLFAATLLLVALLISMGVAYAIISPLQKVISVPILSLSRTAERISADQDFSLRAEKHGNDEVGQLVDAFNAMIGQIEKGNAELLTSENRFRTLVDQAVDAFFLFDLGGVLVDVNLMACKSLGYTREELLGGMTMGDIDSTSADWRRDSSKLAMLQQSGTMTYESLLHRKDSSAIPVEMRLGMLGIGGFSYVMGLARDITERREAETEKKQLGMQLQQAQKMEAIGMLAGGIAHDFNNMLTAIIGYASILDAQVEAGSPVKHLIRPILNSAEKSAELTGQLLAFSRKQVMSPRQVDLNDLIRGMEKLLHRIIGEDIDFRTQLTGRDMTVLIDPGQIEQVLMNLCTNARDAMSSGGLLSITTEQTDLDEPYISTNDICKSGSYALMAIADNGGGMDEETRSRIFEPFFTTKEMGKGTGLGLAIVYGIIKQHNGHINVYSEPGKGTTFRIYLPLVEPEEKVLPVAAPVIPKGGSETILLAEDNEDVRRLLRNVLEGAGYSVIEAADGDEAAARFTENRSALDLVVLDVIMPKRSGKEVSDLIKSLQPEMKILFTSGYTADMISTRGLIEKNIDFISKPVTPQKILVKIREILDRKQGA